jgi:hypothetical protein
MQHGIFDVWHGNNKTPRRLFGFVDFFEWRGGENVNNSRTLFCLSDAESGDETATEQSDCNNRWVADFARILQLEVDLFHENLHREHRRVSIYRFPSALTGRAAKALHDDKTGSSWASDVLD